MWLQKKQASPDSIGGLEGIKLEESWDGGSILSLTKKIRKDGRRYMHTKRRALDMHTFKACPCMITTVDRKIFMPENFRILNFRVFFSRHLAKW